MYTHRKIVVHFDRLKLCHQGTRLPQQGQLPNHLKPQQHPDAPRTGEGLELLEPEPPADLSTLSLSPTTPFRPFLILHSPLNTGRDVFLEGGELCNTVMLYFMSSHAHLLTV